MAFAGRSTPILTINGRKSRVDIVPASNSFFITGLNPNFVSLKISSTARSVKVALTSLTILTITSLAVAARHCGYPFSTTFFRICVGLILPTGMLFSITTMPLVYNSLSGIKNNAMFLIGVSGATYTVPLLKI